MPVAPNGCSKGNRAFVIQKQASEINPGLRPTVLAVWLHGDSSVAVLWNQRVSFVESMCRHYGNDGGDGVEALWQQWGSTPFVRTV